MAELFPPVSDETLMAYADDALEPAERARVETALTGRPDLAETVRRFQRTNKPVQDAFDTVLTEPVPRALEDFVRNLPRAAATPVRTGPTSLRNRAMHRGGPASWQPMALAASLALVIGGASGWFSRAAFEAPAIRVADAGHAAAGGALRQALETAESGAAASSGGVKVVATFRNREHRYCRQYQVAAGTSATIDGFACRTQDGVWDVKFYAAASGHAASAGGLAPAAPRGSAAIDTVIDSVIDGGILDPAEERRTLAGRWPSR